MTSLISRNKWAQLYKDLQRAALQLPQYNYRHFAKRRVRDYFEKYRSVTDQNLLSGLYKEAQENLTLIKRQGTISKLYPNRKLVIESDKSLLH